MGLVFSTRGKASAVKVATRLPVRVEVWDACSFLDTCYRPPWPDASKMMTLQSQQERKTVEENVSLGKCKMSGTENIAIKLYHSNHCLYTVNLNINREDSRPQK